MKKLLLFALAFIAYAGQAQCPVTVNGNPLFGICAGTCVTFTATGAQTYSWMPGNSTGAIYSDCPNTTTTYTVIGTANGGACTDTVLVTVNVFPNPTITATASQNPVCSGTSTTLTCNGAITYTWAPGTGLSCTSCAQAVSSAGSSTTYTVTGCDGNGCCSSATLNLLVNSSPSITFTMIPNSPQVWDAVATFTGGTGSYTYFWDWGDGSPGATTAYPSHTYTAAGWYNICCTITDGNGCIGNVCVSDSLYKMSSANAMITVNVVAPLTGISQPSQQKINIYPNPANQNFTLETNSQGNSTLDLFDLSGRKLLSETFKEKTVISTHLLGEGVYFLRLKESGKEIVRRLIVVH